MHALPRLHQSLCALHRWRPSVPLQSVFAHQRWYV